MSDTPPSRRDLPSRPAGEHGRTGERGENERSESGVTSFLLPSAIGCLGQVGHALPDGMASPIESLLRNVMYYESELAGSWIDAAGELAEAILSVSAARPAPAELDSATEVDAAYAAGQVLRQWGLGEFADDRMTAETARAVADVLARSAGGSSAETGSGKLDLSDATAPPEPHRCRCGHTLYQHELDDEGPEPCDMGGCGCGDWDCAHSPAEGDERDA